MQLSISTATAACSVALLEDDSVIAERHEIVGRGHAERLIPMIESLPGKGRADTILVDCGPGSFTGTRVGLATARALAIAWQIPVHGFSTLALIAIGVEAEFESVAIALNGGHGELFVQEFALNPLTSRTTIASMPAMQAAGCIMAPLIVGSGAESVRLARGTGIARDMLPRAADARKLPDAFRQLPPRAVYIRAPDAVAK
jgi:tRNA threonylcarbamoyl adenosine modification protein YeaZ